MFTTDLRFEGFTADDWHRFLHLWKPRGPAELEVGRPHGGLFVIHDGTRLCKILHTERGRIERTRLWPLPLGELAEAHHASWVVCAHTGAMNEIMDRFGARTRRGDDFIAQALTLVSIAREMITEGAVDSWPRRLRGVPTPTDAMVRKALDAICPENRAILLGMFEMGEVWTAFVARRRAGAFDLLAGPDELRPAMGLLSGDWRRDYLHLARVVEERYAPLGFGCFAEVETFRALQVDPRPGAWGRAVVLRDIVLSPMPAAVRLALGIDGAKYAFDSLRTLTHRVDPLGFLEPAFRGVRERLGSATGEKDVGRILGFDPLAVLRALLRR